MQEQTDSFSTPTIDGVFMQGSENTHPGRVYSLINIDTNEHVDHGDIEDGVFEEAAVIDEAAYNKLETKLEPTKHTIPRSIQVAMDELRTCFALAQKYKAELDGAKTNVKKDYIKKKNRKNSEYAEKIIIFIQRYENSRAVVEVKQAEVIPDDTTCEPQVV